MEKLNFTLIIAILTLLLLLNLIFTFFTWWNSRDQKAVRLAKKLIKVSNKDKIYTEKITKITYDTKQIFNSLFKKVPKDVRKKEITVYLPENLL